MKRAIAYIRVSSYAQGRSGFGLQVQEAEVKAFAEAAGYRLVRILREVASATKLSAKERPELQEALKEARRLGVPLILSRLDRLSRQPDEIEKIASDISVVSVKEGIGLDDAAIKAEAARIAEGTRMLSERTTAGMCRAKQRGVLFGNRLNLDEAQRKGGEANARLARIRRREWAETIASISGWQRMSAPEVADVLNRRGCRTVRNGMWTPANMRRVLLQLRRHREEDRKVDEAHRENPDFGRF